MEGVKDFLAKLSRSGVQCMNSFRRPTETKERRLEQLSSFKSMLLSLNGMIEEFIHHQVPTQENELPVDELTLLVEIAGDLVDAIESEVNFPDEDSDSEPQLVQYKTELHTSNFHESDANNVLGAAETSSSNVTQSFETAAAMIREEVAQLESPQDAPVPQDEGDGERVPQDDEEGARVPQDEAEGEPIPQDDENRNDAAVQVFQEAVILIDDEDEPPIHPVLQMLQATENLPRTCYIKSLANVVEPISSDLFYRHQDMQNLEIQNACDIITHNVQEVLIETVADERHEHFQQVNPCRLIPTHINERFQTNLLDMDSTRIYEVLMATSDIIFPAASNETTSDTFNMCFLCPPTGGIVTGTNMFLDLTRIRFNKRWMALTSNPWKESQSLDKVTADQSLFWEHQNWTFGLRDDLMIPVIDEVKSIVNDIRIGFGQKLDLLIADLSPSVLHRAGANINARELCNEIKNGIITEAGEIAIGLSSIRRGGSLVFSAVDLSNNCTLGSIGFLSGLFANILIVFTRPCSNWIRPATVVCAGYVGVDVLKAYYPDISVNYFASVVHNVRLGSRQVLLSATDMPEEIAANLATMITAWANQEHNRLAAFIESFNENQMEEQNQIQTEAATNWMSMIFDYVLHFAPAWNMFIHVRNVVENDNELANLRALALTESHMNINRTRAVLTRLEQTYMGEIRPSVIKQAIFNPVYTSTRNSPAKEILPRKITYSRFTSLQLIYDRIKVAQVADWYPTEGFAEEVETGVPVTCISHILDNVRLCLTNYFDLNIDAEALVVDCMNLSTFAKTGMFDTELHQQVLLKLTKHLTNMDRLDTLFMCKCPLTTRLLLGAVCLAKNCFKETRLVICDEMRMVGVLFIRFKGKRHAVTKRMLIRLDKILNESYNGLKIDMEPVPLESLFRCIDLDSLMDYNNVVVRDELSSTVNVLMAKLNGNFQVNHA